MQDIFDKLSGGDVFDRLSVAGAARGRLADRGLTPEAVKAGRGVTTPDQIQEQAPKTVNGGFLGGLFSNPLAGVADRVVQKIEAGHGPLVPLEMAAEMTIPNLPAIAKESYRRGEANESTADMYGQAAQGAALSFGPKLAGKMMPNRASAVAQYAKVLDPKGENPALAAEMAGRLIDEGVRMKDPRVELAGYAEKELSTKLNPALDQAISNMPNPVDRNAVLSHIEKGKGEYLNEVPGPNPNVTSAVAKGPNQPVLDTINEYANNVRENAYGGAITPENARGLRQEYDVIYNKRNPTVTAADKARSVVGNALREEINKDPNVATANADVSKMATVKHELAPGATQGKDLSAGMIARAVGGSAATGFAALLGGPAAAKIVGGLLGAGELGRSARIITQHPLWNTTSAVLKDRFAKAMKTGNVGEIADVAGKVLAGVGLDDDYGHDSAIYQLFGDGDQMTLQNAHNKQAVYVQPDGTEIPIPEGLTRATLHGFDKKQRAGN